MANASPSFEDSCAFDYGMALDLRFEPPVGLTASSLAAEKPFFRELEVELDLQGLDYRTAYLVPVY